ncbi:MAG TPA: nicotinate phosphoribosyltransferase, partial [Yinghuangia sp.]|nr:nicotinate phosphoribosyltransferase [Yinghuangia sp.]
DAPFLDSAYKMVEYDGRPVMKLSSAKVTAPGPKQVFRRPAFDDVIGLRGEPPPEKGIPLLETVMRNGQRTRRRPTLAESATRFAGDLAGLPAAARRIRAPQAPRAATSAQLGALTERVRRRIGAQSASAPGSASS